jgi:predicted nucleotidyltransferase component of viral defense system
VIPRAHITAWRAQAPWSDDSLVEQDLVLSRALVELFQHRVVGEHLAFRGGTALNKLFFDPPARFSEDIDLVQLEAGAIGEVMHAIHECLDGWLGRPSTTQSHSRVTMRYRFPSETEPVEPLKVKVEINTREHFSVEGVVQHRYGVSNPWFNGQTKITGYKLDELLGTKLRALYQRKKGRDLFDLWMALARDDVDPAAIRRCFAAYVERQGLAVSRRELEQNLNEKLADAAFREDIGRLLRPDLAYDVDEAAQVVRTRLIDGLP